MRSPWFALADGLSHIASLVASMDDGAFVRPGTRGSGSAGRQVARCLDRVEALRQAIGTRQLVADPGESFGSLARDRAAALDAVREATWIVLGLEGAPLDLRLDVACALDRRTGPLTVSSTVGRELAVAVEHVERHREAIATLARTASEPRARLETPQLVERAS